MTAPVDEALGPVTPAARRLLDVLDRMGPGELERARRDAARLVDGEGAVHLLHDDGTDASRPWRLDPVPLALEQHEWSELAQGIEQRMALLESVLADLYGPATLLREGRLPAAAVLGSPACSWPAVGLEPAGGRRIVVYAADLVRTVAGSWRVLREVTDAPAGAGYALLNRSVTTRLLPDVIGELGAVPLGGWVADVRAAMEHAAPRERLSPRTVVLSPGPGDDTFFEHSYLAVQLGYHLVEPADLVVRDGRVCLRTVSGLEPIDVVLRRVSGQAIDPLEQGDTGVPSLVHSARRGQVGIANAVGSGLAGSWSLMPFLDDLAADLLAAPLRLGALETRWCGDPDVARAVLDRPDGLVLHDLGAPGVAPSPTVFVEDLDEDGWDAWRRRLLEEPQRIVVQPKAQLWSDPVSTPLGLDRASVVLRVHAVAGPDGISVMPGGLGRVVDPGRPIVGQTFGVAKDVWILAEPGRRRILAASDRARPPQVDLGESLPVRAAEGLCWMSRHAERAEALARAARSVLTAIQDDPALVLDADGAWRRAVLAGLAALGVVAADGDPPLRSALDGTLFAIALRLDAMARTAGTVRPYLSSSTWQVLGELGREAASVRSAAPGAAVAGSAALDRLDAILVRLGALSGFAMEGTVRGPAWRFSELGRRLERSLVVVDSAIPLLRELPESVQGPAFDHLLRSHESLIAYRRRYRSDPERSAVVELLLLDATNPRALAFQLDELARLLTLLPSRPGTERLADRVAEAWAAVAVRPLTPDALERARAAVTELAREVPAVLFVDPAVTRRTWGA